MKKRILSTILSLCMAVTMVLSLLPAQVLAQELTHLSHAHGQDAAQSVATQNIGPNEAEVENDLYEKKSAQVSTITLISDIELNGCFPIDWEVTIDLNGHALKMSDIASGSVLKVENGGHLTIIDSNPTAEHKFTPTADGLWVLDEQNGTKTVKGGVITGGTGTVTGYDALGGGVYVDGGGQFTMNGGNIVGCTATGGENISALGGGVYVAANGQFTMTSGSITGCTAAAGDNGYAYGGGIRNDGIYQGDVGRTTLSGTAVIRDCHAKGATKVYGGGISDAGKLTISGDVTIIGCTADLSGSDAMYVNANNGSSITGGMFYGSIKDPGNKISGITVTYQVKGADYAKQVLPSGNTATKPVDPTNSANTAFLSWDKADGTAYDFTQPVTENITLTARFAAVTRKVETKEELTAALADDTVDVIKLGSDIEIDATLNITRAVTLDLVGYMLEMKGSGSVITIKNGGHLTLVDSDLTATYYFTPDADGLWKWGTSGTKTVNGGVIYGGNATGGGSSFSGNGGGVLIEGGGELTMNGGSIVGCVSDKGTGNGTCGNGGGVYVGSNGAFAMNSGAAIIGCVAKSTDYFGGAGGGVHIEESGTFTMNGGDIRDCKAVYGGGVDDDGGQFIMNGGTIRDCAVTNEYGAGAAIISYGTILAINGTVISDGTWPVYTQHINRVGTVIIGADADIQANMYFFEGVTVHANGGVVRAMCALIRSRSLWTKV